MKFTLSNIKLSFRVKEKKFFFHQFRVNTKSNKVTNKLTIND